MGKKSDFFAGLFNLSTEFIKSTLDELNLDENDDSAFSQLAYLFNNDAIEWYCDKCNERLDLQPGFSRSYRTYTCKACRHKNILDYRFVEWKK